MGTGIGDGDGDGDEDSDGDGVEMVHYHGKLVLWYCIGI